MKKFIILIFLFISSIGTIGCAKEETSDMAVFSEIEDDQTIISPDLIGQDIYDALEEEWSAWNEKEEMEKLLSSHMPGACYRGFETLEECEEFLGFSLYNPLENSKFEKGSYVGMPVGYNDAPRFYVNFYGENAEQVNWIFVDSGYRDGDIRITVSAEISTEMAAQAGEAEEVLITQSEEENFVASTALFTRELVTYHIRVIGEPTQKDEVKETLEKVLSYYDVSENPVPEPEEAANAEETQENKPSLLDFLRIACLPVGQTMYVWGGGWNEEDTGAGIEAVTLGVSPAWADFAEQQDTSYNYKETKNQIHDGLDCSGYIGWAVYNVLETVNGKDGYVLSSTKMAEEFANRGLGEYIPAQEMRHWQAGDIMSMKEHVWTVVGMCDDGSVLLLHSSPPGVSFCGTELADGSKSMAVLLAEQIMGTYYPEWYRRFPKCAVPQLYVTESSAMRWSREVLSDEEKIAEMSAEEVSSLLLEKCE